MKKDPLPGWMTPPNQQADYNIFTTGQYKQAAKQLAAYFSYKYIIKILYNYLLFIKMRYLI